MQLDIKKIVQYVMYIGLALPLCALCYLAARSISRAYFRDDEDQLANALYINGKHLMNQNRILQELVDIKTGADQQEPETVQ